LSFPAVQSASSGVPSTELRRPPLVPSVGQRSPVLNVPSVELSTLRRTTNDFSVDNAIGRGGFSTVFEVRVHVTKRYNDREYFR